MSSGQLFPIVAAQTDPQATSGEMATESLSTSWYTPSSLTYNNPYMTPFPSSTFEAFPNTTAESTPWAAFDRPANPDYVTGYNLQPIQVPSAHQPFPSYHNIERPRSSPSTFGPPEGIPWSENPLGIRYSLSGSGHAFESSLPSIPHQQKREKPEGTAFTTPSPQGSQRFYPALAPNPASLAAKRRREEEEELAQAATDKRRKRTPSAPETMTDDDRLLLTLKEEERLPWKDIAARWALIRGEELTVATLQMRFKRMRERYRTWEPVDVEALRQAHEWYERNKWDIISQKMLEFNVTEKWPRQFCARKWQELAAQEQPPPPPPSSTSIPPQAPPPPPQVLGTPYSSPAGSTHYGYMSLQ